MSKLITIILAIAVMCCAAGETGEQDPEEWRFTMNGPQVSYEVGQRVEYQGRIYECVKWDAGSGAVMVPPAAYPDWWKEVENHE